MNEQQVVEYIDGQERYNKILSKELEEQKLRNLSLSNNAQQQAGFNLQNSQNIVELQLNPDKTLAIIKHSISNDIEGLDQDGNEVWLPQQDDRAKILTPYGVNQLMNILHLYINPDVLLSCFNEQQVTWKVKDFAIELSDLIFNRYEFFFNYPSPEVLYNKYYPVCKRNGIYISDTDLFQLCVKESDNELQNKFRHYEMICKSIIDLVHATFLRALNGKERESLRKFLNVSQHVNMQEGGQPQPQKVGVFKKMLGSG